MVYLTERRMGKVLVKLKVTLVLLRVTLKVLLLVWLKVELSDKSVQQKE